MNSPFRRPTLKLRELPHVERIENHAWREGWWQGLVIGFVLGASVAVTFIHR